MDTIDNNEKEVVWVTPEKLGEAINKKTSTIWKYVRDGKINANKSMRPYLIDFHKALKQLGIYL